jgi:hypothetical protein
MSDVKGVVAGLLTLQARLFSTQNATPPPDPDGDDAIVCGERQAERHAMSYTDS